MPAFSKIPPPDLSVFSPSTSLAVESATTSVVPESSAGSCDDLNLAAHYGIKVDPSALRPGSSSCAPSYSDSAFNAAESAANWKPPTCPTVDNERALFSGGTCPPWSKPPSSLGGEDGRLPSEQASGHSVYGRERDRTPQIEVKNPTFGQMEAKIAAKDETPEPESGKKVRQSLLMLPTIKVATTLPMENSATDRHRQDKSEPETK